MNLSFLLLLSESPHFFPAVCHIPRSSQLCALFLEEHSGSLAEQCARVASLLPCDLVGRWLTSALYMNASFDLKASLKYLKHYRIHKCVIDLSESHSNFIKNNKWLMTEFCFNISLLSVQTHPWLNVIWLSYLRFFVLELHYFINSTAGLIKWEPCPIIQ